MIPNAAELTCPICDALIISRISAGDRAPEAGDAAICTHCASIIRFDAAVRLQPMSAAAWDALPPRLRATLGIAQAAIASARN